MIAALLVAAVFAVFGGSSLASGGAKVAITQTVSGGTDNISLTGSGYPANSTISWTVAACSKSTAPHIQGSCSAVMDGTALTDASGSFSTVTVLSVPCGSAELVHAAAGIKGQIIDTTSKKLAC
jgi:hypothetical protein